MPPNSMPLVQTKTGSSDAKRRLISAKDLRKCYVTPKGESVEVLGGLSLDLHSRKVICIIGPSGSGKSTLLRILAGVELSDSGSITYGDDSATEPPPIPMVLQSPALLPWRTVHENIALSLELLGAPDRRERSANYATLMGLNGFSDFLPRDLSGGMNARVSIGRALVAATDVVLFDEAFTELDEVTRQTLNDIFCQHVEERGLAAFVVSHDIAEAVYLADEVYVLTKRPASIAKMFQIQLQRPRHPSIRSTAEFSAVVQTIRDFVIRRWK